MIARFDRYILPLLKARSDCEFKLFFPPNSTLRYALIAQESPDAFKACLEFKKHVITTASKLPNIQVFSFHNIANIVDDLNLYTDLAHYSGAVNSLIIQYIANQ